MTQELCRKLTVSRVEFLTPDHYITSCACPDPTPIPPSLGGWGGAGRGGTKADQTRRDNGDEYHCVISIRHV
jgi:hypothetical protein